MKIAVYTAVFGGFDRLLAQEIPPGVDLICFSDRDLDAPDGWEVRRTTSRFGSPRRDARFHKIRAHEVLPEHDASIWIDGRIRLRSADAVPALLELCEHGMAVSMHPWRDCVYEEAEAVVIQGRDRPADVVAHMRRYLRVGLPAHVGLFATGVVVRDHRVPDIRELDRRWWEEVASGSARDQLSLPFVLWEMGLRPGVIPGDIYRNELFEVGQHEDPLRDPSRWEVAARRFAHRARLPTKPRPAQRAR